MSLSSRVAGSRRLGLRTTALKMISRVHQTRPTCSAQLESALSGARTLEFGGPSKIFFPNNDVPAYALSLQVDNVNFSSQTLWESDLENGAPFAPQEHPIGTQYLAEANASSKFHDYDALISSHLIEHTANPIGVLATWKSFVRPNGWLILVIPHRDATFDHKRPATRLDHLIADEYSAMPETDQTHFTEILALHDVTMDRGLSSRAELAERLRNNDQIRGAHHHVFDCSNAGAMVHAAGWEPVAIEARFPMDIIICARNIRPSQPFDPMIIKSPFRSDR